MTSPRFIAAYRVNNATKHLEHWHPRTLPVTERALEHCPVLVLHYWAIWNLHDRTMDDLLLPLRHEFSDRICFRSCDTDRAENRPFIQGIANIPALGCFIRGTWFRSVIGLRPPEELRLLFNELIAAADKPVPTSRRKRSTMDLLRNLLRRRSRD